MMDLSAFGGSAWKIKQRELEYSIRTRFRTSREQPGKELPDVELPAGQQEGAVRREASRRMITERE